MPVSAAIAERASRTTGGYKSGVQWPPRAGYYTPAKMPLNVIFPRPDGETQAHARQKWAHTGFPMQIPIGVQGGAWPFRYEIIYDPSGAATIGQYLGDEKYGVVEFDNDLLESGETYEYTVRVHGADLVYTDINRSFTVDNTKFVFMQKGYAGTQVGTIDQPLEDIEDWYLNSATDATYHNKILVSRAGTYTATGNSAANPTNITLHSSYKTPSFVGYPGEVVVWDMAHAKIYDNSNLSDIYCSGIKFQNGRSDVLNSHFWWIASQSNRINFWNCIFDTIGAGTGAEAGQDNPSCIFSSSLGGALMKGYFMLKQCVFENVNNGFGLNGSYIDLYRTDNFVIEENLARNCSTNYGWWGKESRNFGTWRGNIAVENCSGVQIALLYGSGIPDAPHDNEICYNILKTAGNTVRIAYGTTWAGQFYNTFVYRNTVVGAESQIGQGGLEPTFTDSNIFAVDNTTNLLLNSTGAQNVDIVVAQNTPILNSSARVAGGTGFATHGGEIF